MGNSFFNLYVEINNSSYVFFVSENNEQNNFKIIYHLPVPLNGIDNNRISDLKIFFNTIKENIYLIEQKLNYTFKEVVLILDNFKPSFINLTGFKKLNGSQVLRENITYILNTLKSCVDKMESNKHVLHIFNSKYNLDNKTVNNLPIGLFGDFYSHELSFSLINSNDFKNLKNVFNECNLKIKKVLLKSFINGVLVSESNENVETFVKIKIEANNTKIFYFENSSLKSEQDFEFGTDIILRDISKITLLKKDTIKKILDQVSFNNQIPEDELVEKNFFINDNYRKIKKKLIYEIMLARVIEISEIIVFKNVNLQYSINSLKNIFLELNNEFKHQNLKEVFENTFFIKGFTHIKFTEESSNESLLNTANRLVHFGWKREAIPTSKIKKSLIGRFFEAIFD